jgi:hypothetical protein
MCNQKDYVEKLSRERCKEAGNKELAGNSYELKRTDRISKGVVDSL